MAKVVTIASLVRTAAKSETHFVDTIHAVFDEGDVERIAEFFDRLNIPRSTGAEAGLLDPLPVLQGTARDQIWDFAAEAKIGAGMQRFLERHVRKIKWHAGHPSIEGTENVLLVFRAAMVTTTLRLVRLKKLMDTKDELTPIEWAITRDLMNKSYLTFRNFLKLTGSNWIDAVQSTLDQEELAAKIGNFYELVDAEVRTLEDHKELLEERRMLLTVCPEGWPPVKPPGYFSGDLLGRGPWKQYWDNVNSRAHHFRESVGY